MNLQDFFQELGATMAEHVMLVVAQEGDKNSPLVAGALNLVSQANLYCKDMYDIQCMMHLFIRQNCLEPLTCFQCHVVVA